MKPRTCLPVFLAVAFASLVSLFPERSLAASTTTPTDVTGSSAQTTAIPGPLRSFLRMAGISQKVGNDDILPLLARNIFAHGYEGWQDNRRPTEFLILLNRYVQQARELAALAGPEGAIHIANCDEAKPLLEILGYRFRQECGQGHTTVETAEATRAFLTLDSGFPVSDLERDLDAHKPFSYPYPTSRVPVLLSEDDWKVKENGGQVRDVVDALLRSPGTARFYWAMSRVDPQTRLTLRQSPGLERLVPYASVLDFYGPHIVIRNGRVLVPGGSSAEAAWQDLVGANPDAAADFVIKLISKDKGWLAAYFDALSRVNSAQQSHLSEPKRLRAFYEALREENSSVDAARPVFRPDPGLLLLVTRLQWDASGEPVVPGGIEAWKKIFHQKNDSKLVRSWSKKASHWNSPEQLVEALFALSRADTDAGPLQIYLLTSELDMRRPADRRLSQQTVALMGEHFAQYSNQFLIFSEFPGLDDESIAAFLTTAAKLDGISNQVLRGNALGMFQGEIGLWQILARQNQIPEDKLNSSWQAIARPFAKIAGPDELFDAGQSAFRELLVAATGRANHNQDEIIDLLAGPHQSSPDDQRIHREIADSMRSILGEQRLVSLDAILGLGDGLRSPEAVKESSDALVSLANELRGFEMPRPIFTTSERYEWATGIYNNRHTEMQMHTDLARIIKGDLTPAHLAEARGHLSPFLRDTLVGLNYAYYEPPGAQLLHNNPLFVRSHDFAGDTVAGIDRLWQAPQLFGVGSPAGGGAHLVGSLADLPYALASAEQEFIAPENVQALIWQEMVPGLLTSSIVPRWWGISKTELHAVALYQEAGEELLSAAMNEERIREKVLSSLSERMAPMPLFRVRAALLSGDLQNVLRQVTPADTFYLTASFRRNGTSNEVWGSNGKELDALIQQKAAETSAERISSDFGVPHPVLALNYARELLDVEPFPAFMGYSSRLLAESWDSNNLYWARLADERGLPPAALNRLAPQLTRRMVEKIFATDFEDWAALLRATRETGDEFRQGKFALLSTAEAAPQR